MSIILNGFTNEYGEDFANIRNIHFKTLKELTTELENYKTKNIGQLQDDSGINIYQCKHNSSKALRIIKKVNNYTSIYSDDDYLVSQLQARQKDVLLTEFPTGIVTLKNKVIGQEIPFYGESITLRQAGQKQKLGTWAEAIGIEIKVLKIIRELLKAGIIYQDIHTANFMINETTGKINLIDFDSRFIKFDHHPFAYNSMVSNLKLLIGYVNSYYGKSFDDDFNSLYTIEEVDDYVKEAHYRILRRD